MDTIQTTIDSLAATAQSATQGTNWWMIVAVAELLVIVILLFMRHPQGKEDTARANLKKQVLAEGEVDFGNILRSARQAEPLRNELLRKCHPDRFAPDQARMSTANDITMRINKSKHDIKALEALRDEAREKLNINL